MTCRIHDRTELFRRKNSSTAEQVPASPCSFFTVKPNKEFSYQIAARSVEKQSLLSATTTPFEFCFAAHSQSEILRFFCKIFRLAPSNILGILG
jgi:hypothetical protein